MQPFLQTTRIGSLLCMTQSGFIMKVMKPSFREPRLCPYPPSPNFVPNFLVVILHSFSLNRAPRLYILQAPDALDQTPVLVLEEKAPESQSYRPDTRATSAEIGCRWKPKPAYPGPQSPLRIGSVLQESPSESPVYSHGPTVSCDPRDMVRWRTRKRGWGHK